MKEKNVLLICVSGITTGLLVRNIQKKISEGNQNVHVYSAPAIIAEDIIKKQNIDAIMIGP